MRQPRVQWIPYAIHSHLSSVVWDDGLLHCGRKVSSCVWGCYYHMNSPRKSLCHKKGAVCTSPPARASQFPGCSRWQHGSVAGCAPESGPLLLEAGDRDVQMWCPGNGVSCRAAWAGTGEQGAYLIISPNLSSLLIKQYSKAKELQLPVPWSIWVCENNYDHQQKIILQICGDQQYGENLWKEMFPNICLQLFLRKMPTQPAMLTEHWGERDFSYAGGGSSGLLTFGSQPIWGCKVSK